MSFDAAGTPLLAAENLSLTRGGRDLFSGLSLQVARGQLWQVEGENGAGKTSLLRILAGLSRFGYEGAVTRAVNPLYLGHHSAVKALLSPRENIAWHPSGEADYAQADIDDALARVGLYGYESLPCHSLSAGQQRRVNLARLYLSNNPLWILDEPFTAIDHAGVAALQARFVEHVAEGGAVLVTSHQVLEVDCEVHRVVVGAGAAA